uniref:Uncharacterized protein n=1 Tax=Anguilla anguilla TaxID=7936 RepID=A0A0E9SFK4_ANGAN
MLFIFGLKTGLANPQYEESEKTRLHLYQVGTMAPPCLNR